MKRALRSAPWLLAAGAISLLVAGVGFGTLGGPVWRILLMAMGIAACIIGRLVSRMPLTFVLAVAVAGARVIMFDTDDVGDRVSSLDLVSSVGDVCVGIAMLTMLAIAVRFRRGSLDDRDGIDLLTVTFGAILSTWIVVTSRLIFVDDVDVVLAVFATMYLPIATLLFTFVVDLLFTGLRSNRAMQFLALGAGANLIGATVSAFSMVGAMTVGLDVEIAFFAAAFAFMCAGLAHSDLPETLSLHHSTGRASAYTPFRLTLTGGCLVMPGVLVAALAPFDVIDVLVRLLTLLALVCTVVIRLFVAVRSHDEAQEALMSRLHHDDLTKLATRARFVEEVESVLEATWRSEFQPTIIQLNLDRFKNINDSLGHDDANEVLIIVSERLSAAAAAYGATVARSGGDDFVIIDATTTSSEEAMSRVDEVRQALAAPVRVGEGSIFVTASFGVAVAPRNRTLTAEDFMRRADIATHRAKAAGRGSVALFDDSMQSHLAHRMDVEHALHGAIGRQEMCLYHQPIVDVRTGEVCGFESLMRWQRDGTIVPPMDFIPIAEETGLICELGAWALHEALGELRGWIDDGVVGPGTTISVNVSPRQIADPEFASVVRNALDVSGLSSDLLWLEMTESMMLEEPEIAETTLREIREMGVRLALDDFGTGYSSLSLLQQFPIQRIKIDRAFVNGIAEPGNDRSLVRTIIAMAHSMGLDLVAEGVETVQQLHVLKELNCHKAQGYLISRPVPADAMRSTMVALDELTSLSLFGSTTEVTHAPTVRTTGRSNGASVVRGEVTGRRRAPMPIVAGTISSRPLGQPVL